MKQKVDDKVMLQYLLGELPEKERSRLEEAYFADDDLYQQMLIVEDELIHAYVQGELSESEREQFETYFLASAQQREKVEFAKTLIKSFSLSPAVKAPAAQRKATSMRQSLLAFFRAKNLGVRLSLAVGFLVAVLGCSLLIMEIARLRTQLGQTQMERTALQGQREKLQQQTTDQRARNDQLKGELESERNERDLLEQELAKLQSPPHIISFELTSDYVRDTNKPNKLVIPPRAQRLRLKLNIDGKARYNSYRATLRTVEDEDNEIWKQDIQQIKSSNSGKTAVLSLSPKLLPTGDYILTLEGVSVKGSFENVSAYYLRVIKRRLPN